MQRAGLQDSSVIPEGSEGGAARDAAPDVHHVFICDPSVTHLSSISLSLITCRQPMLSTVDPLLADLELEEFPKCRWPVLSQLPAAFCTTMGRSQRFVEEKEEEVKEEGTMY